MSTGSLLHSQHSEITPSLRGSPDLSSWTRPGLSQQKGKRPECQQMTLAPPQPLGRTLTIHCTAAFVASSHGLACVLILYSYESPPLLRLSLTGINGVDKNLMEIPRA